MLYVYDARIIILFPDILSPACVCVILIRHFFHVITSHYTCIIRLSHYMKAPNRIIEKVIIATVNYIDCRYRLKIQ